MRRAVAAFELPRRQVERLAERDGTQVDELGLGVHAEGEEPAVGVVEGVDQELKAARLLEVGHRDRDRHLEGLARIAQVGLEADLEVGRRHAVGDERVADLVAHQLQDFDDVGLVAPGDEL